MTNINFPDTISVPIYELNPDGSIIPNPAFHRSWDKLHSRCVEYPFAASKVKASGRILDVGISQADPLWIKWLDSLPIQVDGLDFDPLQKLPKPNKINFIQGDVRKLPIPNGIYDKIIAVSIIEHIGLENPDVKSDKPPFLSDLGDVEAMKELMRVLKPDGQLIMTIPFGISEEFIKNKTYRCYSVSTINRFHESATAIVLDYYEYQYSDYRLLFDEPSRNQSTIHRLFGFFRKDRLPIDYKVTNHRSRFGAVTWRRIPLIEAKATHPDHVDGVLCSVWKKK